MTRGSGRRVYNHRINNNIKEAPLRADLTISTSHQSLTQFEEVHGMTPLSPSRS